MATRADLLEATLDLSVLETINTGSIHGLGISRRLEQLAGETGKP